MPGNIKAALHKFQHPEPAHPEHAPRVWNPPIYGAKKNRRGTIRESYTSTKICHSSSVTWRHVSLLLQTGRPTIDHTSQYHHLRANKSHSSNIRQNYQVD
jgi:hypothetical protein